MFSVIKLVGYKSRHSNQKLLDLPAVSS